MSRHSWLVPSKLLAAVLTMAACASPRPDVEVQGGVSVLPLEPFVLPVVRGQLPGCGDGRFLIDTGSTWSVLDASAASSWGLPLHRYWIPRLVRGGSGHEWVTHYTAINQLLLGNTGIRSDESPVMALGNLMKELSGIIGSDIVNRLVILFEPAPRQVSILSSADWSARRQSGSSHQHWTQLPFRWEGGLPLLDLALKDGCIAPMLIDTGAELSMIPERTRRAMGLLPPDTTAEFHIGGSVGGPYRGDIYELPPLSLGDWQVETVVGETTTLDHGLLGFDILGELVFAFDGPHATLWIAAPSDITAAQIETAPSKMAKMARKFARDLQEQSGSERQ